MVPSILSRSSYLTHESLTSRPSLPPQNSSTSSTAAAAVPSFAAMDSESADGHTATGKYKKDIYLLPCIICRQISADVKMKNYKIKTSFVNSEWPKARFNIAGINFITLFRFSWKIVCNTLLYFIFQYGHFWGEIFIIDFIQTLKIFFP